MKNTKILVLILSLFLITGCSKKNKLVIYLENDGFECMKNVCVKESNSNDSIKTTTVYDIDNNELKVNTEYTSLQNGSLVYNWKDKKITYDYKIINDTFNSTYDLESYEYTCESSSEDNAYKNAECNFLKDDIQKVIDNFNEVIKESKYEIK